MAEVQAEEIKKDEQIETNAEKTKISQLLQELSDQGVDTEKVKEPPPLDVVELCRETFQKTSEYLKGELDGTVEDYKLLETMNKVTISKYSEMKNIAMVVSSSLQQLNEKYKNLQPFLEQIDQIEDSVSSLEQAAYRLDAYSKRLEAKFKSLERR